MDKNLRPYLAELLGSFSFVFLSTAAVCSDWAARMSGQPGPGLIGIALVNGLAYAVALAATLPVSGGYLNPAVTLMLWVLKRLDGVQTSGLIFVQLLGAAIAGGLNRLIFSQEVLTAARLGTPHLNLEAFGLHGIAPGVGTFLSGVGLELALTFVLTFAIFATILDPRAPRWLGPWGGRLVGLWVGLVVIACTLAGFSLTGGAANPARWFGPVIWEKTVPALNDLQPFRDQMVYWVGPFLGALLAGGAYSSLVLPSPEEVGTGAPHTTGKVPAGASSTLVRAKK
jgi:glycerol uptake facilitator-like aquaporin